MNKQPGDLRCRQSVDRRHFDRGERNAEIRIRGALDHEKAGEASGNSEQHVAVVAEHVGGAAGEAWRDGTAGAVDRRIEDKAGVNARVLACAVDWATGGGVADTGDVGWSACSHSGRSVS